MMNSSTKKLISIVYLVFTTFMMVVSLANSKPLQPDIFDSPRTTIKIQNNNDYHLGVRCKSRDDKMGFKILKKGEMYIWSFRANFWGTTLYFCRFSHGEIDKGSFPIFQAGRDSANCSNCTWIAEADGLHGFMLEPPVLYFKWSK